MPNQAGKRSVNSASGPNHSTRRSAPAEDLLAHAYTQLPTALAASAGISLLTVIILRNHVPAPLLISWLAVIWLISALRYHLYRRFQQAASSGQGSRWRRLFLIGLFATGIAWGATGFFMFTEESFAHQVFLTFILGGMVTGATTSLAPLQVPLRIFIVLLLVPLAGRFLAAGDRISFTMGLLLLLYGTICAVMSRHIHKIILTALILKHRNQEEIDTRREAEASLNLYKENLERLILERTRDLARANEELSREIVERKKVEEEKERIAEQLLHSQKIEAIGTLAGGIAHDFNNLLSIMGFTELALEELPPGSGLHSDLQEVANAAARGKKLVSQILEFSRKDYRQPVPVSLQNLISELAKMLRATIPATVEIKTELDPGCGPVLADPNQLQRVLANLATNGIQAMDEKGTLTFGLKEVRLGPNGLPPNSGLSPGPYARISVADTGCGIEPALKKRIFEPFFTTKEVGKGTGMGLAVVHGIVTSNRGTIKVESEPGLGAAFHLFFPRSPPGNRAPPDRPRVRGEKGGNGS